MTGKPSTDGLKSRAAEEIDSNRDRILELSHRIHAHPELAFEEHQAAAWLTDSLRTAGFEVVSEYCDLPTSFLATAGQGDLRLALCAEYDALPNLGHACGHNIIAAAAFAAAVGLKDLVGDLGIHLSVIGTPAEENGGGKILLIDRGAFEGIHAAFMIHPGPHDLLKPKVIGVDWIEVTYHGKAAHASASPEEGINAADAVTIAQMAIAFLRQHIPATTRIHGIVTNAGDAPNVVPAMSTATYMVRGADLQEMEKLRARVEDCFKAGALATGATLEIAPRRSAYAPMTHNESLCALYRANAERLGRSFIDDAEAGRRWAASTDMGNVSLVVPTIQPLVGIGSFPASNHQPEFTAASISPLQTKPSSTQLELWLGR